MTMGAIDATRVRDALHREIAARIEKLEIFAEIESTNTYLLEQPAPQSGMYRVAIAEHQTAGRGRQNREWISAPGASLCLSLAYTFNGSPGNLPGLTLAIGVAARNALAQTGVDGVRLKWPNDLVAHDSKLGGMLAETHVRSGTGTTVVAGIGINVDLPPQLLRDHASRWSQRAIDLTSLVLEVPTREVLSAGLVSQLVESFDLFETAGIGFFIEAWRELDWLRDREITVEQSSGRLRGMACGIDDDGALLLNTGVTTTRIISGSISLDPVSESIT